MERSIAIIVEMLIRQINGFQQALTAREIAKLLIIHIILLTEKDFKELLESPKFIKAKEWVSLINIKSLKNKQVCVSSSKIPDNRLSS